MQDVLTRLRRDDRRRRIAANAVLFSLGGLLCLLVIGAIQNAERPPSTPTQLSWMHVNHYEPLSAWRESGDQDVAQFVGGGAPQFADETKVRR